MDTSRLVEEHIESYFRGHRSTTDRWQYGPVPGITPTFKVRMFEPGPRLALWSYVSIGAMELSGNMNANLEFVILSERPDRRCVELITMVSHYQRSHELGWGHTLPIGEPWLDNSSCTSLPLCTPYPFEQEFATLHPNGRHVDILWVLPITEDERRFKVDHGVEQLEQRFEEAEIDFADPTRPSVV